MSVRIQVYNTKPTFDAEGSKVLTTVVSPHQNTLLLRRRARVFKCTALSFRGLIIHERARGVKKEMVSAQTYRIDSSLLRKYQSSAIVSI